MELSPPAAVLVERIRSLAPRLAAEAPEAERLRRPTDAAMAALAEAGLFRLMVPRRFGGLELDLPAFLEAGLALGEADASLAWVACFCVEHNWMLCQFPESFQRAIYAAGEPILAPAVIAPSGRATPAAGGHRLSGRWQWGTGVTHASWVIAGGIVAPEAGAAPGPAGLRFFALPIGEVKVEDTWYVDGMAGTGSNDIVIEDAFVPEDRSVAIFDLVEGRGHGAALHPSPLYRTPMIPILQLAASMPIVGQARTAVAGLSDRLQGHVRFGSGASRQAEKPASQIRLAQAALELRQAELLIRDVVSEVCALRDGATLAQRARWAASFAHALHQARGVIQQVSEASGASAHFQHHPLQRALRDANVASCHVAFDLDTQRQLFGRVLLGMPPAGGLF